MFTDVLVLPIMIFEASISAATARILLASSPARPGQPIGVFSLSRPDPSPAV